LCPDEGADVKVKIAHSEHGRVAVGKIDSAAAAGPNCSNMPLPVNRVDGLCIVDRVVNENITSPAFTHCLKKHPIGFVKYSWVRFDSAFEVWIEKETTCWFAAEHL
jgi:hypothetical protein